MPIHLRELTAIEEASTERSRITPNDSLKVLKSSKITALKGQIIRNNKTKKRSKKTNKGMLERNQNWLKAKENRLKKKQEQRENQELSACTFQPQTNRREPSNTTRGHMQQPSMNSVFSLSQNTSQLRHILQEAKAFQEPRGSEANQSLLRVAD